MSLGARVRERRSELGLSLDALAARAGVSKTYLWEIENHKAGNVGTDVLVPLARELNAGLDWLALGVAAAGDDLTHVSTDRLLAEVGRRVSVHTKGTMDDDCRRIRPAGNQA